MTDSPFSYLMGIAIKQYSQYNHHQIPHQGKIKELTWKRQEKLPIKQLKGLEMT